MRSGICSDLHPDALEADGVDIQSFAGTARLQMRRGWCSGLYICENGESMGLLVSGHWEVSLRNMLTMKWALT
jgi:hypothetical protein